MDDLPYGWNLVGPVYMSGQPRLRAGAGEQDLMLLTTRDAVGH
jgi:hypothetical protein